MQLWQHVALDRFGWFWLTPLNAAAIIASICADFLGSPSPRSAIVRQKIYQGDATGANTAEVEMLERCRRLPRPAAPASHAHYSHTRVRMCTLVLSRGGGSLTCDAGFSLEQMCDASGTNGEARSMGAGRVQQRAASSGRITGPVRVIFVSGGRNVGTAHSTT